MKSKRHDRENQLPEVSGEVSVREARKRLVVSVRHVATNDAKERLTRATGILLKAATKDTSNHQGKAQKP